MRTLQRVATLALAILCAGCMSDGDPETSKTGDGNGEVVEPIEYDPVNTKLHSEVVLNPPMVTVHEPYQIEITVTGDDALRADLVHAYEYRLRTAEGWSAWTSVDPVALGTIPAGATKGYTLQMPAMPDCIEGEWLHLVYGLGETSHIDNVRTVPIEPLPVPEIAN